MIPDFQGWANSSQQWDRGFSWIRKLLGIREQLCWLGHKELSAIKGIDVQGRLQKGRDDFSPREALV